MDFLEDFSIEKKTAEELAKELEEIDEILEEICTKEEFWMEP